MHALVLTIPTLPDGPDALAQLLRDWVDHTDLADAVAEVSVAPDGEQATATLSRGDRRLQLRLAHEQAQSWRLEAATWLVPAGPSTAWSAMVGSVILIGGLSVSLGYLAWSNLTFWLGVATSAVMAVLVTVVARRRARRNRLDPVEREGAAEDLLDLLEPVVRSDRRVAEVASR